MNTRSFPLQDVAALTDPTVMALTLRMLIDILEDHEQRMLKVAAGLDALANNLTYPVNSMRTTREQVRALARILRDEESEAEV